MEQVQNVSARDARKEILVAAAESDDLVRENRAHDAEAVIVEHALVQRHIHRLSHSALGQFRNILLRERADTCERVRVVPFVVVDAHIGEVRLAFTRCDAQAREYDFVRLGRMRAEGNQHIHLPHAAPERRMRRVEHGGHRHAARVVGNNEQDALAVQFGRVQGLVNGPTDVFVRE